MYNVTALVHTAEVELVLEALNDAVRDVPDALVAPTLPGVRNGGDVLLHLPLANDTAWHTLSRDVDAVLAAPSVSHVDMAHYRGALEGADIQQGTVFRVLLLRVHPDTPAGLIERFEADLEAMPRYVSTITAWQLSSVDRAAGTSPWTHVYAQRFTDAAGITGAYLMHPIHWAYVDRWFDPECPEYIVRDRVCHSFCAMT
jgi:hypothetical protein